MYSAYINTFSKNFKFYQTFYEKSKHEVYFKQKVEISEAVTASHGNWYEYQIRCIFVPDTVASVGVKLH